LKVTVIIQSGYVLSQMIDKQAALLIQKKALENNIEILTQTGITEVTGKENILTSVRTDDGKSLDCEILIVCKGVQANMQFIDDTDIKKHWGILSNSFMQTNYQNIYTAGDVAETYDLATENILLMRCGLAPSGRD